VAPFPKATFVDRVDTPVLTDVTTWEFLILVEPMLADDELPRATLVDRVDTPVLIVLPT